MARNDNDDNKLDALLRSWQVSIDTSELAVDAMTRAARMQAVQLKEGLAEHGFFGLVAQIFGFRRASGAIWSAAAGMSLALVVGISLGASNTLPSLDETAFSIDFDSVIGAGTLAATTVDQDL